MILVHRLHGDAFFVNADLIESVEATPDTVLTLIDGRKTLVRESPDAIARQVVEFRASVLVAAERQRLTGPRPPLSVVPTQER